ncbi:WD domain, G-beta repeat domain-containing protein [Hirsutella rhossiliensis]|uniref:WD domain, g-beta repeat domain-containing protein n=1 Tax=Hirsutella rhossiliensis TaxID=111463 RepID=A0A9P8SD18_9HYPO|nr:WD domain, g-beta repeat domain-containing protein [Hirsutella rhossiliensis]KAH0958141.1 WD domain, g-beta repeat domain-containing protein [Hirsutella rhossiliensis]
MTNSGLSEEYAKLRIIFSGQRDGVLDALLSSQASISLETSAHEEDIQEYCQQMCNQIQDKFKMTSSMRQEILSLVINEAKGMFLYELEPGTFPQGLEKAFERVVSRVLEQSSEAEREDSKRILALVTCTKRALLWREIQAFFCIDPVKGEVNYDERLQVGFKELCGSLVDAHHVGGTPTGPEAVIHIVHETARHYLISRNVIDTRLENAKLSIFCSRYLTSEPFKNGIEQDEIKLHATRGCYALQDYTVQYWFHHLHGCVQSSEMLDPVWLQTSLDSAQTFLKSYMMNSNDETGNHGGAAEAIKRLSEDDRERNSHLSIEFRTTLIRREIEKIQDGPPTSAVDDVFENLHGVGSNYKCFKPWCKFFMGGIATAEERKNHVSRHDLPFYCTSDGCFASQLGFSSPANLNRHKKNYHDEQDDGESRSKVIELLLSTGNTEIKSASFVMTTMVAWQPSVARAILSGSKLRFSELDLAECRRREEKAGNVEVAKAIGDLSSEQKLSTTAKDHGWTVTLDAAAHRLLDIDLMHTFHHNDEVLSVCFSPDGKYVATSSNHSVQIYDVQTGEVYRYLLHETHFYVHISSLCFSPDEHYIATAGDDKVLRVWDIQQAAAHWTLYGHEAEIYALAFARNGRIIASGGGDGTVRLWDPEAGVHVGTLSIGGCVTAVAISPDSKFVAVATFGSSISVWDMQQGAIVEHFNEAALGGGHENSVYGVAFSPDGHRLVSGSWDMTVKMWELNCSRNVLDLESRCVRTFQGCEDLVLSVDVIQDASWVICGSQDRDIHFWDTNTQRQQMSLQAHTGLVLSVAASPRGGCFASGSSDGTARIWSYKDYPSVLDYVKQA